MMVSGQIIGIKDGLKIHIIVPGWYEKGNPAFYVGAPKILNKGNSVDLLEILPIKIAK